MVTAARDTLPDINFCAGWRGGGFGLSADNISVEWTRPVHFEAGSYRFSVTADEGVRLWIDGTLRVNQWSNQTLTTYTTSVTLPVGYTDLRVQANDSNGPMVVRLTWEQCRATVPVDRWKGEYFTGIDLTGAPGIVRSEEHTSE